MRLVEWGVFDNERIELLGGMLVRMSPQGPRHAWTVLELGHRLALTLRNKAYVRHHSELVVSKDSAPAPDLAVIARSRRDAHPRTALLVVEVARTSLAIDRGVKTAYYAGAGIPEYWIVDLVNDVVEVFTRPNRNKRRYGRHVVLGGDAVLRPLRLAGVEIPVAAILPPARKRKARRH